MTRLEVRKLLRTKAVSMQFEHRVPPHPGPLPKESEPFQPRWKTHLTVTFDCAAKWFSLSPGERAGVRGNGASNYIINVSQWYCHLRSEVERLLALHSPTLQRSETPTLQHSDPRTLQRSNAPDAPTLLHRLNARLTEPTKAL